VLVVVLVIAVGAVAAFGLRWYCDDTFITLRYVDNYLHGHGLVYNEGERVEGYTHFLWLLLLIVLARVGFDPLSVTMGLGVLSYVGVLAVFCLISYRLNRGRLAIFVPLTGLVLAIHRDFLIWATGGLETMFFTFLLSLAFYVYFFSAAPRRGKLLFTSALLILATLSRPDGALIYALANVFLVGGCALRGRGVSGAVSDLVTFNLPLVPLMAPYLVWKYLYYGDLLPNTYYAKSAGSFYFDRGFFYLWLYFKPYFTSWLALLGIPAAFSLWAAARKKGKEKGDAGPGGVLDDPSLCGVVFAITAVALYLALFVARVGGDFMYARFIVPALPFLFFVLETSILIFARGNRFVPIVAFVLIALSIGLLENSRRDDLLQKTEHGRPKFISHKGIIDEHYLRTVVDDIDRDKAFGEFLRPHFEGLDATVLLKGRACIGHYAGFKTNIEYYGLTDKHIAHLLVEERSRPGHEKTAPHEYLLERGVDFGFNGATMFFERAREHEFAWFNLPDGRRVRVQLFTYDVDLIETLARRMGESFEYTNFVEFLDAYIARDLPRKSGVQLLTDYMLFRDYYFEHNKDYRRERAFTDRISGAVGGTSPGSVD
jgi:hypothetical protein